MSASIPVTPRKRGRPSEGGRDPIVPVRMPMAMRDALDGWIAGEPEPQPSRSEAVRRALADHLRAKGHLPHDSADAAPDAPRDDVAADVYADADPEEGVMVTGVGPMTLRRAVRKRTDWREHHGLGLVSIFRGADKEPSVFDVTDLDRLAELERFR